MQNASLDISEAIEESRCLYKLQAVYEVHTPSEGEGLGPWSLLLQEQTEDMLDSPSEASLCCHRAVTYIEGD